MMQTLRRSVPRAIALVALALSVGCAGHQNAVATIPSGDTLIVTVTGDAPLVQIENRGPGVVDFEFRPTQFRPWADELILGSVGQTMRGGGEVILHAKDQPATVEVDAQRSTGLNLKFSNAADESN